MTRLRTSHCILAFAVLISLASVIVFYLANDGIRSLLLFNSDLLYLPTVFSDVFQKHGAWSDWYLPPAPYFFPDYLVFGAAYLIGATLHTQVLVFTLLQILIAFGLFFVLARQIGNTSAFAIASTTITVLMLLSIRHAPFTYLLASAIHYGGFLCSILFVVLWNKHEDKPADKLVDKNYFIPLIFLAFLGAASDNLFTLQTSIPFLVANCALNFVKKRFDYRRILVVLAPTIFSVLGNRLYILATPKMFHYGANIKLQFLDQNLPGLLDILHTVLISNPAYGIAFLAYLAFVACALRQAFGKNAPNINPKLIFITIFSACSLVITLGTVTLSSFIITERYFIPLFSWPIFVVICWVCHYAKEKSALPAALVSLLAAGFLGSSAYQLAMAHGLETQAYPIDVACIDKAVESGYAGIAEYWDAKYLISLSKHDLTVAQYGPDLSESRWITSQRYFKDRYDFAVLRDTPEGKEMYEKIVELNGLPKKSIACDGKTVYLYPDKGLRVR